MYNVLFQFFDVVVAGLIGVLADDVKVVLANLIVVVDSNRVRLYLVVMMIT